MHCGSSTGKVARRYAPAWEASAGARNTIRIAAGSSETATDVRHTVSGGAADLDRTSRLHAAGAQIERLESGEGGAAEVARGSSRPRGSRRGPSETSGQSALDRRAAEREAASPSTGRRFPRATSIMIAPETSRHPKKGRPDAERGPAECERAAVGDEAGDESIDERSAENEGAP